MNKKIPLIFPLALILGVNTPVSGKSPAATFAIGQLALGGMVFYVDSTRTHGLVAAVADAVGTEGGPINWNGDITNFQTNALGSGIGAGQMNTSLIVSEISLYAQILAGGNTVFSAWSCALYCVEPDNKTVCTGEKLVTGYSNWYLPSIEELNLLENATLPPPFSNLSGTYWSSTEIGTNSAYSQTGTALSQSLKSDLLNVRCISAF